MGSHRDVRARGPSHVNAGPSGTRHSQTLRSTIWPHLGRGTQLLFCSKNIERIGDHITNIAEAVYYIVEGHELEEERPKADTTTELASV